MSEDFPDVPSVDMVERKGGGAAAIVIGVLMLAAIIVGAIHLYNQSSAHAVPSDAVSTDSGAKPLRDSAARGSDGATR